MRLRDHLRQITRLLEIIAVTLLLILITGCTARPTRPEPCQVWVTAHTPGGWKCVSRETFSNWARQNLPQP